MNSIYLKNDFKLQNLLKLQKLQNMLIKILLIFFQLLFINGVIWKDDACITNCMKYNNYHYCYTSWTKWKKCDPINLVVDSNVHEEYYKTKTKNVWCTGRCGKFSYHTEWCFVGLDWKECTTKNAIRKTVLNHINSAIEQHGTCDLSNLKIKNPKKKLKKRNTNDIDVNNLASNIISSRDYYTERLNNPTTSITDYSTIRAPSIPNHDDLMLTVRIRARIRYNHLQSRTSMSSRLNTLMRNMDMIAGQDERGHLIAASLGGTNDPFNIVPQYRGTNRRAGSNSHWFTVENEIRTFVNQDRRNSVGLHVIVLYNDLMVSRRPRSFVTQTIFYNSYGYIFRDSGSCYFTNNPNGPDLDEPDLGFIHDEFKKRIRRKPPTTTKKPKTTTTKKPKTTTTKKRKTTTKKPKTTTTKKPKTTTTSLSDEYSPSDEYDSLSDEYDSFSDEYDSFSDEYSPSDEYIDPPSDEYSPSDEYIDPPSDEYSPSDEYIYI